MKKILFLVSVSISVSLYSTDYIFPEINYTKSQDTVIVEKDEPIPFVRLEKKPIFPGGDAAMMEFIAKNVKYPQECAQNGIEGIVVVTFIIDREGKVTDAKVVRGKHPALDKEALRVVNMMPVWEPGKKDGESVRVSHALPIMFKLQY